LGKRFTCSRDAKGVHEFPPRVAATLGSNREERVNAEGVGEPFQGYSTWLESAQGCCNPG